MEVKIRSQFCCCSVAQSCLSSLQPHRLQQARLPCPSLSPGVCSNSCALRQWYHPTISSMSPLSPLNSVFASIRFFSNESVLHIRWPEYRSFSFSISPSNENSGLISFRIDWFDLLAVLETLKSLLQHQSSKAINSSPLSHLLWSNSHIHTRLLEKP